RRDRVSTARSSLWAECSGKVESARLYSGPFANRHEPNDLRGADRCESGLSHRGVFLSSRWANQAAQSKVCDLSAVLESQSRPGPLWALDRRANRAIVRIPD